MSNAGDRGRSLDIAGRYDAAAPTGSAARPENSLVRPAARDSLIDVLDRVLDKGVVIAGDIKINLLDIELLTIKIRLLIASADKAREMGIDWWESDPSLSSTARKELESENRDLRERLERLESAVALEEPRDGRG